MASQPSSQVVINDGETERFFIPKGEQLEMVSVILIGLIFEGLAQVIRAIRGIKEPEEEEK